MKKIFKEVLYSLKERPLWTTYSILLCPFYYFSVFITAVLLGAINLSFNDFVDFIKDNT